MRTSITLLLGGLFSAAFSCGWHAARGKGKREKTAREKANEIKKEILKRFNERKTFTIKSF